MIKIYCYKKIIIVYIEKLQIKLFFKYEKSKIILNINSIVQYVQIVLLLVIVNCFLNNIWQNSYIE